jgi:hypothetical protein
MKFQMLWTVSLQANNEKKPTPALDGNAGNRQAGRNASPPKPKLYRRTPHDFCKCLIERPTFTGSLPFLYRFLVLTAKVLADGHHSRTATRDAATRCPHLYRFLPFLTGF